MSTALPLAFEHVPADRTDAAPGLVVLHGRGADERDLLPVATELPGDRHVLSLRAPTRLGGGHTWYELDLDGGGLHASQPDPSDWRDSLEAIVETVDGALDRFGIDPDELGVLGFSQGAVLSMGLLIEHPDRFAWIAALHGYLPDHFDEATLAAAAGAPAFLTGGRTDQIIPASRVESAAERLSAAGVETTVSLHDVGHGIGPDEHAALADWIQNRTQTS